MPKWIQLTQTMAIPSIHGPHHHVPKTLFVTHVMICDDEGHFEVHRAGVLPLREPLAYRWYQFPRLYPPYLPLVMNAGEPVDFLCKPHLCVDMLDRTDTEAIVEAIAITDGFAHYAGLEFAGKRWVVVA